MKTTILAIGLICTASAAAASSNTIRNACIKSDRNPSKALCTCIQQVADLKLTGSDQKLAAKFFDDPHLAQETRQSDNAAKEKFWRRYKEFGEIATRRCS